MIVMIYFYLLGVKNGVFQGIFVFVGLIIFLGFSMVIGNVIVGLVIIYMCFFKLGDWIQLNDIIGNVIEKMFLVIWIKILKNEVVIILNLFIMLFYIVNYSVLVCEYGLIIYLEVIIGYDVFWCQVYQLLIEVVLNIFGVIDDLCFFVFEILLSDWYLVY